MTTFKPTTQSTGARTRLSLGPVLLEVVRGGFQAIVNEMALGIRLSAHSLVITEGNDFSGGLFSRDGHLISGGETDLPVHVGTGQPCLQAVIRHFGLHRMRRGDVYAMNDPFLGNTHFNDLRMMMPLFVGDELVAFAVTSAHWTDIGGAVPGSFNPMARECYQEGLRITPIAIVRQGKLDEDLLQLILSNVRNPRESEGDFYGQLAACRCGAARFDELVGKYGLATVLAAMDDVQTHSEAMLRREITALPDGEYTWEDSIDEDVYTGHPKTVRLRLTIDGDSLTYDFTASDPPAVCGMNAHRGTTVTGALVTLKLLFPEIPINAGMLRPIEVITRDNTIVDAQEPHAVAAAGATTWDKISNCCIGVFSSIIPERVPANSYNIMDLHVGGRNRISGEPYVFYIWLDGGQGATMHRDGGSSLMNYWAASTKNIPVELLERRGPVRIEAYEHRPGTAGAGTHRGGFGTRRSIRVLELDDGRLAFFGDRGKFPGQGLFGGKDAAPQRVVLLRDGQARNLGVVGFEIELVQNDEIVIEGMGGAGFGDPLEREPGPVLEDVRNGYLTIDEARADYGVCIRCIDRVAGVFHVDPAETEALRNKRRASSTREHEEAGIQTDVT
jgi:N-methylhydantoinase B